MVEQDGSALPKFGTVERLKRERVLWAKEQEDRYIEKKGYVRREDIPNFLECAPMEILQQIVEQNRKAQESLIEALCTSKSKVSTLKRLSKLRSGS